MLYPVNLPLRIEGKIKSKKNENLFEKIRKENFPNSVREIDKSRKHRESQNKLDPNRTTPRHIIIKMPKVKNKERILKQQEKSRGLPTKEFQ